MGPQIFSSFLPLLKNALARDDLRRLRTALERVETKLQDKDDRFSQDDISELRALDELLNIRHRYRLLWARPWLAGFLVLLLLGTLFLFAKREKEAVFAATVHGPVVHFELVGGVELSNLRGRNVRVGGMEIDLLGPESMVPASGVSTANGITTINGNVTLESLQTSEGGDLSISFSPDSRKIHFHFECSRNKGCADAHYLVAQTNEPSRSGAPQEHAHTQLLKLRIVEPSTDLALRLTQPLPVTLISDTDIHGVSFLDVRETSLTPHGSGLAWSGVRSGQVQLPGIDRTISLGPGEWINIGGSRLRIARVSATDSALTVIVRGQSDRLELATGGSFRDLKPTWMELLVAKYERRVQIAWVITGVAVLVVLRGLSLLAGKS